MMKTFEKIAVAVIAILVLVSIVLGLAGFKPQSNIAFEASMLIALLLIIIWTRALTKLFDRAGQELRQLGAKQNGNANVH